MHNGAYCEDFDNRWIVTSIAISLQPEIAFNLSIVIMFASPVVPVIF